MKIKSLFSVLLGFAATACMQVGVAALNVPSTFDDNKLIPNVAYGDKPWQKLDIYIPPNPDKRPLDVVVFFYGGSWQAGSKDDYRFVGSTLADNHFIVVIPDYVKYPQGRFPEFVQDGAKAVAWVYDHIETYQGSKKAIHLMGHSAGAHTAALLTADERYLAAEGKKRKDVVKNFVGLAGPYAFTPEDPTLKKIFAPPSAYGQMHVTTFIDGSEPPMLLLWGDKDKDVGRFNMDKLVTAIRAENGCYQSVVYDGVDHISMVVGLSWARKSKAPILYDSIRFLRGQTGCTQDGESESRDSGATQKR